MLREPGLREFIASRKAYINRAQQKLMQEAQEIEAIEKVLGETIEPATQPRPSRPRRRGDRTIQQMALDVLRKRPAGGSSDEIKRWINEEHGLCIPRTSLTPQLSRMRRDGELQLDRDSGIWRTNGGPNAA